MRKEKAIRLHTVIVAGRELVDDKTASIAPELFGRMKMDGSLIPHGTRINWNGTLKRAAVDLWDRAENTPDNAPVLWEDIQYRAGYRIIPEIITVGLKFSKGECGWWGDVLYRSKVDENVTTPETYPDHWEAIK
jgi:hypothetical protein